MSIGIDLGNDYMVVTAVRQGVDVLQNDIGKRKTRMAVTYNADNRDIGDDSFSQYLSKFNMSAMYFKRLLGKQYGIDDEDIAKEKRFLPNKFSQPSEDGTPSTVKYVIPRVGEVPPEQALCTMLLKAKQIYEVNSEGQQVQECVITVPTSWNNAQRLAMMHAADMAGLKVLELSNETTCILYQYGLQRDIQDTRIVMFFDIGATSTSCTLARISKETAEVLAYETNPHLGGRDFIECIVEEVVKYCKEKKNIDIEHNSKAWLKVRRACEKTFHTLSANHDAHCSVENVLDGVDISVPYTRESFYTILEARFKDQILEPIQKIIQQYPDLMKDGKLQVNFFEIIGGVTRVPFVQKLVIDNFGVTLSKTLDADEAIARGAALRCAALSTTKKIRRKFQVTDKKVAVELFLNKAPEGAKEGDQLSKYVVPAEDVILTKSFLASYPTTYPQPRLLSLKFQQVQLPVMIGVRMNGSKTDNVRSLILPQSRVDGRLLEETADGNVPTDIKVSLSLNSSGYLNVFNVETVPAKVEVPAPTMTDAPATALPTADAVTEGEAAKTAMNDAEPMSPQVNDEGKKAEEEQKAKEEAEAAAEANTMGDDKNDEEKKDEPVLQLEAPHEPTKHEESPPTPASPTPQQQKPIPLCTYNQTVGALSTVDLNKARESEQKLQERDAATAKRQEVYNNLESHLFTTRSRLNDPNDLPSFMEKADAENAAAEIKKVLDWLDDEGYCAELEDLEKKLVEIEKLTHAANIRLHNWNNLKSSHFAYKATLDVAVDHKYVTEEKFAPHLSAHQKLEEETRQVLATASKLDDNLSISSQHIDKNNSMLRNMINAMNTYDPVKEAQRQEQLRQQEIQKKQQQEMQRLRQEQMAAAAAAAKNAAPSAEGDSQMNDAPATEGEQPQGEGAAEAPAATEGGEAATEEVAQEPAAEADAAEEKTEDVAMGDEEKPATEEPKVEEDKMQDE